MIIAGVFNRTAYHLSPLDGEVLAQEPGRSLSTLRHCLDAPPRAQQADLSRLAVFDCVFTSAILADLKKCGSSGQ